MDVYKDTDTIPLSFSRVRNNALVTGLTVTVTVKNAVTNSVLLSSTSCPEISGGAGIYTYNWTHGLSALSTECLVQFTVGSNVYSEYILVTNSSSGTAR